MARVCNVHLFLNALGSLDELLLLDLWSAKRYASVHLGGIQTPVRNGHKAHLWVFESGVEHFKRVVWRELAEPDFVNYNTVNGLDLPLNLLLFLNF